MKKKAISPLERSGCIFCNFCCLLISCFPLPPMPGTRLDHKCKYVTNMPPLPCWWKFSHLLHDTFIMNSDYFFSTSSFTESPEMNHQMRRMHAYHEVTSLKPGKDERKACTCHITCIQKARARALPNLWRLLSKQFKGKKKGNHEIVYVTSELPDRYLAVGLDFGPPNLGVIVKFIE